MHHTSAGGIQTCSYVEEQNKMHYHNTFDLECIFSQHRYFHSIAGTETTRMTLNWIWCYLAAFPEIQQKAQEEIDSVLGKR